VVVTTSALVTKGQVLTKGKIYGGIPAKELPIKPKEGFTHELEPISKPAKISDFI